MLNASAVGGRIYYHKEPTMADQIQSLITKVAKTAEPQDTITSSNQADMEAEMRSVYGRDQSVFEDLITVHHAPKNLPRELQEPGTVLSSKEAIPKPFRLRPPASLSMIEEHEGFHSSQGLCFPHRCHLCFDQDEIRRERDAAFELERLAESLEEERKLIQSMKREDFAVHQKSHIERRYVARTCKYCQGTTEWDEKYGNKPLRGQITTLRGEVPGSSGGRSTTISVGKHVSVYVGMWTTAQQPLVRWIGYRLIRGDDNPYDRTLDLTPELEATLEPLIRYHLEKQLELSGLAPQATDPA